MAVYLEAVHTVHPLTSRVFDRYVELYGEFVVPKFAEYGLELLGAWKRTGGTTGQDLLLLRFDSLADMERAMASLAMDPAVQTVLPEQLEKAGVVLGETTKTERSACPMRRSSVSSPPWPIGPLRLGSTSRRSCSWHPAVSRKPTT